MRPSSSHCAIWECSCGVNGYQDFTYTYRAFSDPDQRELMAIATPEPGSSVDITRNGAGQVTTVKQGGKTRQYNYDGRHFLMSKSDPETGATLYGRDAIGNMTGRTVGATAETTYVYDNLNRLKSVLYPDNTSVQRTYYKDDKLKSVDNGRVVQSYVYDRNKNLQQEILTIDGNTIGNYYTYNSNDALSILTYGSGKSVSYNPDGFGRPTQALPYVTAVSHHPSGAISSMRYANGVQTTVELNPLLLPASLTVAKDTPVLSKNYFYDNNRNVIQIDDATTGSRIMTYDNIDRLKSVTGAGIGVYNASYDGRGNILKQAWGDGTNESRARVYSYDPASDLLTGVAKTTGGVLTATDSYTYDPRGNVSTKGGVGFRHDSASNMVCAQCGQATESVYDYDGSNLRVRTQKNGVATYFIYGLGGKLLWEQTPGVNLKEYIYLGGKQVATRQQDLVQP